MHPLLVWCILHLNIFVRKDILLWVTEIGMKNHVVRQLLQHGKSITSNYKEGQNMLGSQVVLVTLHKRFTIISKTHRISDTKYNCYWCQNTSQYLVCEQMVTGAIELSRGMNSANVGLVRQLVNEFVRKDHNFL